MDRCVKCWAKIWEWDWNKKRLWCSVCLDEVNKELTGQQNKPYQYYFKYHLKQQWKSKNTI
jgi:hypothetical protein